MKKSASLSIGTEAIIVVFMTDLRSIAFLDSLFINKLTFSMCKFALFPIIAMTSFAPVFAKLSFKFFFISCTFFQVFLRILIRISKRTLSKFLFLKVCIIRDLWCTVSWWLSIIHVISQVNLSFLWIVVCKWLTDNKLTLIIISLLDRCLEFITWKFLLK